MSQGTTASPAAAAAVVRAVEQFNARLFWECHETLEDVWGDEQGPLRDFYHGLIQLAAGFLHVERRNWHGAVRLLGAGLENLEPFRPACLRVDLDALLPAVAARRAELVRLGPARIGEADATLPPSIRLLAVAPDAEARPSR